MKAINNINLNFRVGTALRLERNKRKMTQQEVADLVGLTREAISMLERGQRINNLDTLTRVSNALGQPLWKIVKKSEELGTSEEILADVGKALGRLKRAKRRPKPKKKVAAS